MPRLSIVVPYYNVEGYIAECLESLRLQTLRDIEVVLVDDGSVDGSREVAAGFCERDDRFRIVTQDNQGLGPARNTGARHAEGEYLTFVDSDDVIALPAYERLVGGLADSGSDFASYGACRFSNVGVMPSLVQAKVCATTRTGTHVRHDPVLGMDRMAWNKVYRREFFEEQELVFPAMLLEDFPVSVRAHTRARAVDVDARVFYAWRVRDGGEPSITQRSAEVGNVADRLTSALDVLEVLEAEAPDSLPVVRQHLLEVDVQAIVAAMRVNTADDRVRLLAMAQRLLSALGPGAGAGSIPFYKVQAVLVERGDLDGLLALHEHLRTHGKRAPVLRRGLLRKRYAEDLPLLGTKQVPDAAYEPVGGAPELTVSVEDAAWSLLTHGVLGLDLAIVTGTALGEDSRVRVWLEGEEGRRVDLEPGRYRRHHPRVGDDLGGVRLQVDPAVLAEPSGRLKGGFWRLVVELDSPTLSATASVLAPALGRGRFAPTGYLPDRKGLLVQPYRRDAGFGLLLRRPQATVEACAAEGEDLVLTGWLRAEEVEDAVELVVVSREGEESRFPVEVAPAGDRRHDWRVVVPAGAMVQLPSYADPVAVQRMSSAQLLVHGELRSLALGEDFVSETAVVGTRGLTASCNIARNLELVESRVSPEITAVAWTANHVLRCEGVWRGAEELPDDVLLEHFPEPDRPVQHRARLERDGRRLAFEIDARVLVEAQGGAIGRDAQGESAPWHLLVMLGERLSTLVCARDAAARFAGPRVVDGHRVQVHLTRNDVVRLSVGPA